MEAACLGTSSCSTVARPVGQLSGSPSGKLRSKLFASGSRYEKSIGLRPHSEEHPRIRVSPWRREPQEAARPGNGTVHTAVLTCEATLTQPCHSEPSYRHSLKRHFRHIPLNKINCS